MALMQRIHKVLWIILVMPGYVQTAEWSIEPRIEQRTGYNDNIRLTTLPHDSVWEVDLDPSARFGVATENSGLFGNARMSIQRFFGGSGANRSELLDRENYYLDTDAYYMTERTEYSLPLKYIQDSTLDSEFDETGQDISSRATRALFSLSPNWSHSLDEITRLNLSYSHQSVKYSDDPGIDSLIDNDYNQFSASISRQFTPKIQGNLSASYNRFKPETGFNSDTVNLQIGISRNFSETLSTSWLAGLRDTTSDTLVVTGFCIGAVPGAEFPECTGGIAVPTGTIKDETDSRGTVFSVSVTKLFETGDFRAELSRSTSPGARGELLDITRLGLTGKYQFNETLRSRLSATYFERETIVDILGRPAEKNKRSTFRVRPELIWQWRQEWQLSTYYEYTEVEQLLSTKTVTSNAFYLTLSYQHPRISLSR